MTEHKDSRMGYFRARIAGRMNRLKAAKRRVGLTRRKVQLKGGYRVTESINIKRNRIVIDHQRGEIVDRRNLLKSIYSFGPKTKVIAKIEDIEEIKLGMQTANFIEIKRMVEDGLIKAVNENLCLSIVFKSHVKTIDLIAPSVSARRKWYRSLLALLESSTQYQQIKHDFDLFLLRQFRAADLDHNGVISFDEALALLRQLNITFDDNEVHTLFDKANFRKSANAKCDGLDTEEFMEFYNLISYTKALHDEFACITKGKDMLNMKKFKRFLENTQKFAAGEVEPLCEQLIAKYEPLEAHKEHVQKNGHIVSCKGFRNMVMSPEFDIVQPQTRSVHQDMSRPLVDYYIATSHNTYLYEDQLEGRSTTETYRIYLSQGCRCVELDMADGGDEDKEPVVFHKRTLTSKMELREIVDTIADYAFKNSPYPVIISLENNCKNLVSQRKAAQIFRKGFGSYLITEPLFGSSEATMPSPENLKYKIIIKGKRLPPAADGDIPALEQKYQLAKELSDLVWYAASKKFTNFEDSNWNYNEMTSIEEAKSEKYSNRQLAAYRHFTSRYLTKVYPHGLRFFSGNYNPIAHWRAGAQMVSLNYQTKGNPMLLNQALFAFNGDCGYVLKAPYIDEQMSCGPPQICRLLIRVLFAFNLPIVKGHIIDPFVQIRLFGVKKYTKKRRRTKTVNNNGLNPQWNKEFCFDIEAADMPLVFVRFQVFHQKVYSSNQLIGQRMITLNAMAEGYRNIALHDQRGNPIEHAKLVVAVEKDWNYWRRIYGPTKL